MTTIGKVGKNEVSDNKHTSGCLVINLLFREENTEICNYVYCTLEKGSVKFHGSMGKYQCQTLDKRFWAEYINGGYC